MLRAEQIEKRVGKLRGLNVTQRRVAEKAGISAEYLSRIVRGWRKRPSADVIDRIERALVALEREHGVTGKKRAAGGRPAARAKAA
jgi:transcriptional regulator with XRE-family HTH domain